MEEIGIRGVIQFFFLERKTAKEIHEKITPTLGNLCLSYETVGFWVNEIKQSRTSIETLKKSTISFWPQANEST